MDATGLVTGIIGMAVGLVVVFGGPGLYLYLQARALRNWSGWWRLAALPPLVVMAHQAVMMVQAFRDGSNLAPVLFILISPLAAGWLATFALLRARALS